MMVRRVLGWVLAAMLLVGGVPAVIATSNTGSGHGGKTAFASLKGGKKGHKGKKGGKKGKHRGKRGHKKATAAISV
jgi:hypothetical protein